MFIEKAFHIALSSFHKWYGLVAAELVLAGIALSLYELLPEGRVRFLWYGIAVLALAFLLVLYWAVYKFYYPRRSKKRLGLAIAISGEELQDKKYLDSDFLKLLRQRIKDSRLPFDFLPLKPHQIESVESVEDARKVLRKTRAHFCLWGSVKRRQGVYLFELRAIVVHKPIEEAQRVLLVKEFNQLLPHKEAFEESQQLERFEFRADQAYAAIDYISGRAALLSGDYNTAIQLHEALYEEMTSGLTLPLDLNRLKKLLAIEYVIKGGQSMEDSAVFRACVEKSLAYNPHKNYGALLQRAILEFDNGNGDPHQALATIKKARKCGGSGEWAFSLTFLQFWIGDFDDALKSADRLRRKTYRGEGATVTQVIAFNESLLRTFPKPQIYFWTGFLEFEKIKNYPAADQYFEHFLSIAEPGMEMLIEKAKEYLTKTRTEIGY